MSEPTCFEEAIDQIDSICKEVMIKKQMDYGHGNILAFGELGILVRLSDKLARLKNLIMSGQIPSNESLDDSWLDSANYPKIAMMLRRGTFTLPLRRDAEIKR